MGLPGALLWAVYLAWLAFFAWMGWRAKVRLLLSLGAAMVVGFVATYAHLRQQIAPEGRDPGGDFGDGLLVLFAALTLLLPLVVAAILYPIGRLWRR